MFNFLLMIIAFGLMVTIHELGHFLAARACGVGIEKFSIGFGKPIVQWTRKGVDYRIAWLPLGGYLKMTGENPDEADDPDADDKSFQHKAWWKKAIIAFSGPLANLVLGFALFIFAFMLPQKQEDLRPVIQSAKGKWATVFMPSDSLIAVNGTNIKGFQEFLIGLSKEQSNSIVLSRKGENVMFSVAATDVDSLIKSLTPQVDNTIGEVFTGLPAWRAGLKKGDIVIAVDSVAVADWYSMRERIIGSVNKQVELTISRKGKVLTRLIALEKNIAMGEQRMIGISQDMPVKSVTLYTPKEAVTYGSRSTVNFVIINYVGLYKLIRQPKELQKNLGGPVMIASISQQAGQRGFSYLIIFFGSISLALTFMNLLPIPILDGGHILFAFLEGIFGRPVPVSVQALLQRIGFALLIVLMAFAFYTDITKLLMRLFSLNH
ncbi:MAG: RIP metalloprotease RseP [Candidatus Cloacimonetes bacterium HGW-Cloacimonetes-3]|jgi:regulator of sigma E protease|nr:MAG: RIP metalloprotease RseP [Candidatus Cloacimonetes bacterium HGW-Cloacimonetes-3]